MMAQLSTDQKNALTVAAKMARANACGYRIQETELQKRNGLGDALKAVTLGVRAGELEMFAATLEDYKDSEHGSELIQGWLDAP
jgi:hypothetical protein